jgi:outer membrane receptor protein involved in Fe transport
VSPKASLVVSPLSRLELFGNFGLGFHSNDARGVLAGATALTRATAYEVGLRFDPVERLTLRADVFRVDLASELVWVGDEGTTEARGPTRRDGVEAELHATLLPWLWATASGSFVRARFVSAPAGADAVPLAPTRLLTGALTALHPSGASLRLSVLHVGDRYANEDRSLIARGFVRVDATAGYRAERYELAVSAENLLDTVYREAQFAQTSRLPDELTAVDCPPGTRGVVDGGAFRGCDDIHFPPGTPLAVKASATVFF